MDIDGKTYYGVDAENALKVAQKYDYNLEHELRAWIEECIDRPLIGDSLQDAVKSGIPLLELVCFLKQGIVDESKWNKREIALHYVANLKLFISAVVTLGLKPSETFNPNDVVSLRHKENLLHCLDALARLVPRHERECLCLFSMQVATDNQFRHGRCELPKKYLLKRNQSEPAKRWAPVITTTQSQRILTTNDTRELRSELYQVQEKLARVEAENEYLKARRVSLFALCCPTLWRWWRRRRCLVYLGVVGAVIVGGTIFVQFGLKTKTGVSSKFTMPEIVSEQSVQNVTQWIKSKVK